MLSNELVSYVLIDQTGNQTNVCDATDVRRFGPRDPGPRTQDPGPGTRYLGPGTRYENIGLVGTRDPGPGFGPIGSSGGTRDPVWDR